MNCIRLLKLCEQQSLNVFKISARLIANHPIKFIETQDRWRQRDGISKRWQLIYKAPMDNILNYVTTYLTFSTTTIAAGAVYYAAFVLDPATINDPVVIGEDLVIANSAMECLTYLGAFIIFHVAVKILLSKYVIRLYQDGDEYLAIFRGSYYNSIKKHLFRLDEFKKLKPALVVTWSDARFSLGNKHGILLEHYFKTPEHFNYLRYKNNEDKPDSDDN
ncbi:hypothetical protein K1T71_003080 [Dendrolimus kikuchii]|uniref:Uncharacterized protein n=1 Tax=Dendrolimus kikuchii TaxID=765133 RepID=A0ACC1DAX8_9NEOP|nr:hypothetical protein K1T71_003080 [Dendrolimus kikuchii]